MGYIAVITLSALALALNGCSTVEGMGKDIEVGGEYIQDKADS